MRVNARFRPSIVTPTGTWQDVTGDWDGQVLWVPSSAAAQFGVHLGSRSILTPVTPPTPAPAAKVGK